MNYLPCPFCGTSDIRTMRSETLYYAMCWGCNARTGCANTEDEVIEGWNLRSDSTAITDSYYDFLDLAMERYDGMATIDNYLHDRDATTSLRSFIGLLKDNARNRAPLYKMNRWLGYIQGVLCERKLTDVQTERDWSRPYLRPLDFPEENKNKE